MQHWNSALSCFSFCSSGALTVSFVPYCGKMGSIQRYLYKVGEAVDAQDGQHLRELLFLGSGGLQGAGSGAVSERLVNQALSNFDLEGADEDWVQFLVGHCQCMCHILKANYIEAYDCLEGVVSKWLNVFRADRFGWTVLPTRAVTQNLELLASRADDVLSRKGQKKRKGEAAGKALQNFFGAACQTKEREKKKAALGIANVFFKVHFKLQMLQMCSHLMRNFINLPFDFEEYPMADRVTYKYYAGRLALAEQKYQEALENLHYAFKYCDRGARRNMQRVLVCLIPVQMLYGELPTQALLDRYELGIFDKIVEAVKTSDLAVFNGCIKKDKMFFVRTDTHLVMERLRQILYRQILCTVVKVHNEAEPGKKNRVPLSNFQVGLRLKGEDMDMEHIMCIMANLIAQNFVKGYVSFTHGQLVLAKDDPFPSLKDAQHSVEFD